MTETICVSCSASHRQGDPVENQTFSLARSNSLRKVVKQVQGDNRLEDRFNVFCNTKEPFGSYLNG